jgi:hypothetical protein
MKSFVQLFSACILLFSSEIIFAQTGSDYYLPLSVGSQLNLHTTTVANYYTPRATLYTIEGTDVISGLQCFRELGTELSDVTSELDTFHILWLSKDSGGNLIVNAISIDGTSNPDSALIVDFNYFPNEFLTPGYSRTYNFDKLTKDSVVSVTETVTVPAGTFNNCIVILETQFDSTGIIDFQEYHYYAYGVGEVKKVRTIPNDHAHTDVLMSYVVSGVNDEVSNQTPDNYLLSQNYPNPFNPSTVIKYQLPVEGNVTLKVFDVLGNEVASLLNEYQTEGSYDIQFDAGKLTSGIYFYQLQAGSFTETKKLLLLR